MIIVFPMLVSRAVSENSIPGIAKLLENYIIIYKQDLILQSANENARGGRILRRVGGKFILGEAGLPPGSGGGNKERQRAKDEWDVLHQQWQELKAKEKEVDKKLEELKNREKTANSTEEKNRLAREKQKLDIEKHNYQMAQDALRAKERAVEKEEERKDKEKDREAKKAQVSVKMTDMKSITLEPTYIIIERGDGSTSLLGVKVVPLRVKSDVKLSHLLLYDSKVNAMFALALRIGRKVQRIAWSLLDRWRHGVTPSGDPRRDIIMGRTGMGPNSDTFIVLSKQEDVDEFFLDNISRVNRLFKMGWGNFILADDIARTAYFCMTSFRGICSAVPYSMMYQYLNQSKAYETMEDAKKASSSIFKVSKKFSSIIGEQKVYKKLIKYSS